MSWIGLALVVAGIWVASIALAAKLILSGIVVLIVAAASAFTDLSVEE